MLNYKNELLRCLDLLPLDKIETLSKTLRETLSENKSIYLAGNGGSAANASHFKIDLTKAIYSLFSSHIEAFDSIPTLTAVANDISYDKIMSYQLRATSKPNDLLIVLSVSGNSPNIINVVEAAKEHSLKIFALLGKNGGKIKSLLSPSSTIVVPSQTYGVVEDIHMCICHMLANNLLESNND